VTLTPEQMEMLAVQRKAAKRALAQGRRWFLRGVLMFIVACVAGYRGGQLNMVVGIAMVVLAALCFSLGRNLRKNARESLVKIDLMEKT
jgi:predicted anti-sigma-YlaC factor YlaD